MSSYLGTQQAAIPNRRTVQMVPSPKGQPESSESVRSKLRDSLSASLALVSLPLNKQPAGKNPQNEVASTAGQACASYQLAESTTEVVDATSCHLPESPPETLTSSDYDVGQNHNESQCSSQDNLIKERSKSGMQDSQPKHTLLDDVPFNSNFIIKDELLQGNGLCWVSDIDGENAESKEGRDFKRPKLAHSDVIGDWREQPSLCPQTLAMKIEAELFKLFGGVNKKYKEKGRSLLFNLKDRNNPELREKVMLGEIAPERLCSMTAEELASKELSQWRIAKAEELAQMVVLPDSEVDIRRLVRKTHKGEFQVEFEQDDSVSVEVAVGASSLTHIPSRTVETEAQGPLKSNEDEASEHVVSAMKNDSGEPSPPSSVMSIPHDNSDLMQGLMVDELKDAEFLPPIVSLDEFMESLDSEPPFENLSGDFKQDRSVPIEKDSGCLESKMSPVISGATDLAGTAPDKPEKVHVQYTRSDSNLKTTELPLESQTGPPSSELGGEHAWEGLLQLSTSAMVTVIGLFRSGERTSTKDWPSFIEIKGRVRLDAFEKFLQELPMSRSRAIMVVEFCWKEGSLESGRSKLSEVANSYVMDERVGFSEPAPGVELYFCPPHPKTTKMIGRLLPKEHTETLVTIDSGLIGIVVWRKAHVTHSMSPKMSHQKQNSKKHQFNVRRHQVKDATTNLLPPPLPVGPPPTNPDPPSDDDSIDDIPPGFGPPPDEDDLPEFDFVKGPKPQVSQMPSSISSHVGSVQPLISPQRPMEQMRELIQKYGQGEMRPGKNLGVEIQPWNDDDDIPEWQPNQDSQPQPRPPQQLLHGLQSQTVPTHLLNQQQLMSIPSQPTPQPQIQLHSCSQPVALQQPLPSPMQGTPAVNPVWQQPGLWWGSQGPGPSPSDGHFPVYGLMQPCHFGSPTLDGQLNRNPGFGAGQNGMDWRPDMSRSRGV